MKFIDQLMVACAGLVIAGSCVATPISGQGTWEQVLRGRNVSGQEVPLSDPTAVFFYDTQANITWLADLNPYGPATYTNAKTWVQNLTIGGFSDWRLPRIVDSGSTGCQFSWTGGTDCGYNSQSMVNGEYSEWAYLFYSVLGNKALFSPVTGQIQDGWGFTNTAYFKAPISGTYWSDTTDPSWNPLRVWNFAPNTGLQQPMLGVGNYGYSVAVRTGDVLALAVPELSPNILLVAGIAVLSLLHLRRRGKGTRAKS